MPTQRQQALLLSIRPKYADMIFEGAKKVELRKKKPRIQNGDIVIVYVSSPVKAIVGAFQVCEILEHSPSKLWDQVKYDVGINEDEYYSYYDGADKAIALMLRKAWVFAEPVSLENLRSIWSGFHPPQSFRYLSSKEVAEIGFGTVFSAIEGI